MLAVSSLLALSACGGGSSTDSTTDNGNPPPVVLTVTASNDSFNLLPGATGDVLANDQFDGAHATSAKVTVATRGTVPAGLSLSAAGVLSVAGGIATGSYTLGYRVCETAVPTNCADASASVTVPAAGTLTGRALDGDTGLGVAGVAVTAGALSATTDANGNFSIANVPVSSQLAVNFSSAAYAESGRAVAVTDHATTDLQIRLTKVAGTTTLDAATGGNATVAGSTAQVSLPANGLQRADGSTPSGSITVGLTPLAAGSDSSLMPGSFSTQVSGATQPIESFGALNVKLADSAGTALNLRSGQTATIRIPVSTRSGTTPASIPLFYYDTASGLWVQEGTATLVGSGSTAYYQGTVSHFSTWNADQIYNTVRITGCVANASGVAQAGAVVTSDGIDYTGTSRATTDANGLFSIAIRKSGRATLSASAGSLYTNTVSAGPYTVDASLGSNCLTLGQTGAGVTMKLTWGARPSDLDSHLLTPSGSHISYNNEGSLTTAPYANLDVDDTSSYGPEVVTVSRLMVGTYRYYVHNYSGYSNGPIASSGARVELNIPGRTLELFVPPSTGEASDNRYWNLFSFTVDANCAITLQRVNDYSTPTTPAASTPVYCTAP